MRVLIDTNVALTYLSGRVFNLVNPNHSDSWNCMSDLHENTLMAQVLTNVIIGNTSSGKGDHFWDNGEGNLLKALILYIDYDSSISIYSHPACTRLCL